MHHILPDRSALLAGQNKRMRRINSVKKENNGERVYSEKKTSVPLNCIP